MRLSAISIISLAITSIPSTVSATCYYSGPVVQVGATGIAPEQNTFGHACSEAVTDVESRPDLNTGSVRVKVGPDLGGDPEKETLGYYRRESSKQ